MKEKFEIFLKTNQGDEEYQHAIVVEHSGSFRKRNKHHCITYIRKEHRFVHNSYSAGIPAEVWAELRSAFESIPRGER